MTKERYNYLSRSKDAGLTPQEIRDGWHFCWEWDGLLINIKDEKFKSETECCICFK